MKRRTFTALASLVAVATVFAAQGIAPAQAQDASAYPSKPIRIVIPFPPGGATDIITRRIGGELTKKWGQPVIVENKPGANTVIGTDAVGKAEPDGYTILMTAPSGLVQLPSLLTKLPYDPVNDFQALTQIAEVATALVVPAELPVKSVKELAEYLRANPSKTAYASLGLASTLHIYGEAFKRAAKADSTHIPYKGDAPAMTDLVSGRVQYMFNNPVSAINFAKQGRVRILAVTGDKRLPALPEVPTMAQAGFPGFETVGWFSFFVHAKVPRPVVEKLHAALAEIIRAPEMSEFLKERGTLPTGIGLQEFAGKVAAERREWARLIRDNDIRLE
jgi:tripartite-type tricarboxylate transporter receptor subunit TctC